MIASSTLGETDAAEERQGKHHSPTHFFYIVLNFFFFANRPSVTQLCGKSGVYILIV